MFHEWIVSGFEDIPMVLLSCAATYFMILVYTRLVGLRSLSKMSAPDFAMTVAVGSLFASTIAMATPALIIGLGALASLFAGQWLLAWLRCKSAFVRRVIDNQPLLLMDGPRILDDNLRRANVTRADLYSRLRSANVHRYEDVLAVVFETTGDVSVLHSSERNRLEPDFLRGVYGAPELVSDVELPDDEFVVSR